MRIKFHRCSKLKTPVELVTDKMIMYLDALHNSNSPRKIDNKICHRCSKINTPVELVIDRLIMSLDGLHTSNLPRQIDHPKYTIFGKMTLFLEGIVVRRCYM